MRADDIPAVRGLRLFAGMSEDAFADLVQGAFLQRFPPQVTLVQESEPADFLYVLVEGRVELFAGGNGRETTMAIVEPITPFILAAVLKDAVFLMSARTLDRARVLMIPAATIRETMERDPPFTRAMVQELADAYRGTIKSLKSQKLRTAVERLGNWLLAAEAGQGGTGMVTLTIDKRTLAALLGMTPENLSRAFAALRPYGVEVVGRDITLNQIDDLRRFARPHRLIDDPAT